MLVFHSRQNNMNHVDHYKGYAEVLGYEISYYVILNSISYQLPQQNLSWGKALTVLPLFAC